MSVSAIRKPPKAVPSSAYNAVVDLAEVCSVDLLESRMKVRPERYTEDDLALFVRPAQFFGCVTDPDEPERRMMCGVRFALYVIPESVKAKLLEQPHLGAQEKLVKDGGLVEVFAEYNLLYKVPPHVECTDEIAMAFAGRNGVFNAWPFFRELAHSLVSRTGLPHLVVPLFRLPPDQPVGVVE